jgi:hypothetical protein
LQKDLADTAAAIAAAEEKWLDAQAQLEAAE